MEYLSTAAVGKLCDCTRVWAFNKSRAGFFDEFKLPKWRGKHYRFRDCRKLRALCSAIKADRNRARLPKAKPPPRSAGIATWQALAMDFDILRRQIGDKWKRWKPEDIDFVRQKIAPILAFNVQLLSLRRKTRA